MLDVRLDKAKNLQQLYPAIYCQKQFDVINHVTYHRMTCGFMRLANLKFEMKLQNALELG